MSTVKETRRFRFTNVIVKPDDIRDLARIMTKAAEPSAKEDQRLSFVVVADDDSQYDASTPEVFAKGGILEAKQVQSINLSFSDYVKDSRISINVTHGSLGRGWNEIVVAGTDSTWVNGVTRQFEEAVSGYEKQVSWPKKIEWPLRILTALGIGRAWDATESFVLFHIVHIQPITPRPTWAVSLDPFFPLIQWSLNFFMGIWPSILLTQKLIELWPPVELRMGREWSQVYRKRRERLWLVVSVGVIPLLLSFLYDLFKNWLAHKSS